MRKIRTGISGLDEMLYGGMIVSRAYLIKGTPGAGKTIFGIQFLTHGVKENEKTLFISLEEKKGNLIENMAAFGWDLSKINIIEATPEIGSDMWEIKGESPFGLRLSLSNLMSVIGKETEGSEGRIVIDSLTTLKMLYDTPLDARREVLTLIHFLSSTGWTSLLLAETHGSEGSMESFLADGVVKLHSITDKGIKRRAIEIEKMRGTDFDEQLRPMKITNKGIVVYSDEALFKS
ncbi:MAG: RAD55 family ATPase [Candidatus Methanofastidiosia archaeon]